MRPRRWSGALIWSVVFELAAKRIRANPATKMDGRGHPEAMDEGKGERRRRGGQRGPEQERRGRPLEVEPGQDQGPQHGAAPKGRHEQSEAVGPFAEHVAGDERDEGVVVRSR